MLDNSTSTQPLILIPVARTVIGPLVIASWLNWMFMGTLIVQTYFYHYSFPKDRKWLRVLVYSVVAIDIAQTLLTSHQTWFFTVANWNDESVLLRAPWSAATLPIFAGVVSCIVQSFYAWRIWILSNANYMRGLAILITLVSWSQALCAIVTSIVNQFTLTQERLLQLHPYYSYWLAGSFVADILIGGGMIHILLKARSNTPIVHTEGLVNRLIKKSIQTGLFTSVCAGVDLALFVTYTSYNYHYVPAYILGKLYTNSLLAMLNSRRTMKPNSSSEYSYHPESFGMRLQVSKTTEQVTDSVTLNGNWTGGKVDLKNTQSVDLESKSRLGGEAI